MKLNTDAIIAGGRSRAPCAGPKRKRGAAREAEKAEKAAAQDAEDEEEILEDSEAIDDPAEEDYTYIYWTRKRRKKKPSTAKALNRRMTGKRISTKTRTAKNNREIICQKLLDKASGSTYTVIVCIRMLFFFAKRRMYKTGISVKNRNKRGKTQEVKQNANI